MPTDAERMSRLRSKFASYNKNGDKYLDFDELSRLLLKGNPNMTDEELHICFNGVDKNHDGKIDFDEFVEWSFAKTGEQRQNTGGVRGPERFFYDQSTYTGVHTHGGPSTIDGNSSLAGMCRPNLHSGSGAEAHHPVRHDTTTHRQQAEVAEPPRRHTPDRGHRSSEQHGGRELRGPERFFYDKSSYTGVHTQGGPSTIESHHPVRHDTTTHRQHAEAAEPPRRHTPDRGHRSSEQHGGRELRGPERFFYDKSSYTGVHTRGGPH